MARRSVSLRLDDMIDAAQRVREVLGDLPLDDLEADWQRQWLMQLPSFVSANCGQ